MMMPLALTALGQASLGGVHAVLDVHRGQVGIAVQIEGGNDGAGTVIAAGRGDVLHSLGAVDLLLERDGDGGFHRLRAGAGVKAGHRDLRRSESGKLRNRQSGNHHTARQDDQQSANCGEDRPSYEEVNEHEMNFSDCDGA